MESRFDGPKQESYDFKLDDLKGSSPHVSCRIEWSNWKSLLYGVLQIRHREHYSTRNLNKFSPDIKENSISVSSPNKNYADTFFRLMQLSSLKYLTFASPISEKAVQLLMIKEFWYIKFSESFYLERLRCCENFWMKMGNKERRVEHNVSKTCHHNDPSY